MLGFRLLSRQVEHLGVKIIELFLRNVLSVVNFYTDETKFEAIAKGRSTVDTISFSDLFHFFYTLYKLTYDLASSLPFSLKEQKKRFLFPPASYVVNNLILHLISKRFLTSHARVMFYNALVQSVMDYGACVWVTASLVIPIPCSTFRSALLQ